MASVMVSLASCLMALVTSSLVSRTATLASTGTAQAHDGRPDLAARLAPPPPGRGQPDAAALQLGGTGRRHRVHRVP